MEFMPWNIADIPVINQEALGLISIMADSWTIDTTKAAILGVTAHWIEVKGGKWKVWVEVVGFQLISGDYSGGNVRWYLIEVFDWVGIMGLSHSKVYDNIECVSFVFFLTSWQLLMAILDNISSNMMLCATVKDIYLGWELPEWCADKNQLPYIIFSAVS